jgi:hypothetical protein
MKSFGLAVLLMGIGLSLAGIVQQRKSSLEYPTARIREEQQVAVNGAIETWELEWRATPHPACEANEISLACPCAGFAYGEAGDLEAVRLRERIEIDRLRITPFFSDGYGGAIVQRWKPGDNDLRDSQRQDFPVLVGRRPTVRLMYFADYNHDGWNTEFYLQTDAERCGRRGGIVIGVSKRNPRLHVFGTKANPNEPLYMQKRAWEALRSASAPIEVLDWPCGDHGAETETTLRLRWTPEGIAGSRREYACPGGSNNKKPIHEEPL